MPNDKELLDLEKNRQEESDYVLDKIKLLDILDKYGEVNVVGAKALELMIAKDIDISVVVEKINYEEWKRLVGELMTTPEVRKVAAIDYFNYDEDNRFDPDKGQKYSLYVEMDTLIGRSGERFDTWECQVHLIERKSFLSKGVEELRHKLTPEKRLIILRIKYWADQINKKLLLKTDGNYKIQSTEIYPLVLSGEVSTIEGFVREYLPTVGVEYREDVEEIINVALEDLSFHFRAV